MSANQHRGGKQYLSLYPQLRKWVQQCCFCQSEGYKLEMPDMIGVSGIAPANIRQMFPPLALDKEGVCDQCRAAQSLLM
jgi:hypothetical protein